MWIWKDHKHDKYITTSKFNKLTAENFAARLAQASGKSHFEDDGTQNYLVFQITYRYFKTVSNLVI